MPKLKTHRGAAKRRGANRNHILTKHTTKKKRDARVEATRLKPCDARLAKRMLQGS